MSQSCGETYRLELEQLEILQMEDFRQGNIISQIEIMTGRNIVVDSRFDRLFPPPHKSAKDIYHEAHKEFVVHQLSRIAIGETTLVVIVPSYGADLLAICRNVTCHRV